MTKIHFSKIYYLVVFWLVSTFSLFAQNVNVTYKLDNDWGNGYTATITLKNNSTTAINSWTVVFDMAANGSITNLWNGNKTQSGTRYTVKDAGWNAKIDPNATVSFGFQVAYSGSPRPDPYNLALEGSSGGGTTTPTISITSPTNNTTVSGTTSVTANVTGSSILGVQFYLDGNVLGAEVTTSPYTISWNTTTATNGNHSLTAKARTSSTNVTSAAVTANVQNTPTANNSNVEVTFKVTNDWGNGYTAEISLKNISNTPINGWTLGFSLNATITNLWNGNYTASGTNYIVKDAGWNAQIAPNGMATFGFQISYSGSPRPEPYNGKINGTAITIKGTSMTGGGTPTAPTVSISSPTSNSTVSGTINVNANVGGQNIQGVQFYLDGNALGAEDTQSPYSVSWNTPTTTNGNHTLMAKARNAGGTTTSQNVMVNVNNTTTPPPPAPPTVSITSPTNNSMVSNTINVDATVGGQSILGVQFYLDGNALGAEDTQSPYSVSWNTTTTTNGNHTLTAKARNAGGTTTSATVTVNVNNSTSPPPTTTLSGYLSASGSKLVNDKGQEVRITGVNWFGFETSNSCPHGLWTRDYRSMLKQIKAVGFNTLRLPFGSHILENGRMPNSITFGGSDGYDGTNPMNQPLQGKTALQVLDAIIEEAGKQGLKIFLDNHSHSPDNFANEPLWYTGSFSEQRWIENWVFLANRYKNNPTVIGADLDNEPHNEATWGNSNASTDWNKAAERCGTAILNANPNWLIIVEGVQHAAGSTYWWGGNLSGAANFPVNLPAAKLVYSPHDYGPEVHNQSWFSDGNFPNNMPALWDARWGFLFKQNKAPILVGEFGIHHESNQVAQKWIRKLMEYMGCSQSWTYWCWNPNSGDTGGILADDWKSVNQWKVDIIKGCMAPALGNATASGTKNNSQVTNIAKIGSTLRLSAFPNPTATKSEIVVSSSSDQNNLRVVVSDVLGRPIQVLFNGTIKADEEQRLQLSTTMLPNGTYRLQVIGDNGEQKSERITVMK